ncbi:MAG: hypothetical protein RIC55_07590 [Pirellulaceae bacterium]
MTDTSSHDDARQLLNAVADLPQSDAKLRQLERVVQLADADHDLETGLDARLTLIRTAVALEQSDKRIVAYLWCLGLYEREPERFRDSKRMFHFLWWFKGLSGDMFEFPRISLDEIDKAHQRMQRVYEQRGLSLGPLWGAKFTLAMNLGDIDQMREHRRRWQDSTRTILDDCAACILLDDVRFGVHEGRLDEAIDEAEPLLTGRVACGGGHSVQSAVSNTLRPMIHTGRHDEAEKWGGRGYRLLRRPATDLYDAAAVLAYAANRDDRSKGLSIVERFLNLALHPPSPDQQLRFYLAAAGLMRKIADTGRRRKMRLPRAFPLYDESAMYQPSELADWFDAQSRPLIEQFDRRNGNDYYSRVVPTLYAY